jgi:3-hydroxyisobutyrate dehydrogenase
MTNIAFMGLGHMGFPMAKNLLKAGHNVVGFDLVPNAMKDFKDVGGKTAQSIKDCVAGVSVVITMLPEGKHVRAAYEEIFPNINKDVLIAECSTIDIESSQFIHGQAESKGLRLIDAPVSGGVGGAETATLTFMVGGKEADFNALKPYLEVMGKNIIHCGGASLGQAAKICNNLILGISMIGVCEGFNLAEKLGLDMKKFFEVASQSSAQCWSITKYCPVPGPVPTSPANREYAAGFTSDMMLKDLKLAENAASLKNASSPLGAEAQALYSLFCNNGGGALDFSGIMTFLKGKNS